jgi:hypothetical protein
MHEGDSALGFSALNDPRQVHDPSSFQKAASNINFAFNWFYTDSRHIAYYLSGWYPQRSRRTSPDFPILGTGQYDWRGYDPRLHTARWLPFKSHPHGIDRRYFVNWNNHQAKRWNAADDNYHYGSEHRQELLADKVRSDIRGPRKIKLQQLVQAMEETATQDLRGVKDVPVLLRAVGHPKGSSLRRAVGLLRGWHRRGAHRRDLNRDGHYDDDAAVTLMDAWWPNLVSAEFRPALHREAYGRLAEMVPPGDFKGGEAYSPDFETGWYGYVSKDLRDLFGPRPRGAWSRVYCGKGSRRRCRAALRRSLRRALRVTHAQLYGRDPDCANRGRVEASCFDETRSVVAAGVDVPPFPWINRPTFQQTVELRRHLPRISAP